MRHFISYFLVLAACSVCGQGTFTYDQQSANESAANGASVAIQAFQPFGQSFSPTNSSVGFIRLNLADNNPGNGLGAIVGVNLRSNSITGPIMASSAPVSMLDNFGRGSPGFANFFFTMPVAVTPGLTYYFQVVALSGDPWSADVYTYIYQNGTAFEQGVSQPGIDLWFREGIYVVPEPSSISLIIGSGVLFYVRHKKNQKRAVR
jgi:hypothetical protein